MYIEVLIYYPNLTQQVTGLKCGQINSIRVFNLTNKKPFAINVRKPKKCNRKANDDKLIWIKMMIQYASKGRSQINDRKWKYYLCIKVFHNIALLNSLHYLISLINHVKHKLPLYVVWKTCILWLSPYKK